MKIEFDFSGFKFSSYNLNTDLKITTPEISLRLIHNDEDIDNELKLSVNFINELQFCNYAYGTEFSFRIFGFGIYFWRGKL